MHGAWRNQGNKMSAKKTGGTAGRQRAADSARAAWMAAKGIKRTMMRDPITYKMVPIKAKGSEKGKCWG